MDDSCLGTKRGLPYFWFHSVHTIITSFSICSLPGNVLKAFQPIKSFAHNTDAEATALEGSHPDSKSWPVHRDSWPSHHSSLYSLVSRRKPWSSSLLLYCQSNIQSGHSRYQLPPHRTTEQWWSHVRGDIEMKTEVFRWLHKLTPDFVSAGLEQDSQTTKLL
jgi:hypothetical protein